MDSFVKIFFIHIMHWCTGSHVNHVYDWVMVNMAWKTMLGKVWCQKDPDPGRAPRCLRQCLFPPAWGACPEATPFILWPELWPLERQTTQANPSSPWRTSGRSNPSLPSLVPSLLSHSRPLMAFLDPAALFTCHQHHYCFKRPFSIFLQSTFTTKKHKYYMISKPSHLTDTVLIASRILLARILQCQWQKDKSKWLKQRPYLLKWLKTQGIRVPLAAKKVMTTLLPWFCVASACFVLTSLTGWRSMWCPLP